MKLHNWMDRIEARLTYEPLQRRMAVLKGIARGEKAVEEGHTLSMTQARQRMARWLK